MPQNVLALVMGAMTWGLLEYVLHRFVGHQPRSQTAFAREHRAHHAQGNYFAPTSKKALAAVPVLSATALLGVWSAGSLGMGFAAGLTGAYLGYEWLHRRLHTHAPRGPWGRFVRRHHFHHHFGDPRTNHGVTTPVLDALAGTLRAPCVIRVPVKLAPLWLLDPSTGEVRAAFVKDYAVVRPPVDTSRALMA